MEKNILSFIVQYSIAYRNLIILERVESCNGVILKTNFGNTDTNQNHQYVEHFIVALCNWFLICFQDDIGDKSVFMFNALGEDEKKALIAKLELQELSQSAD